MFPAIYWSIKTDTTTQKRNFSDLGTYYGRKKSASHAYKENFTGMVLASRASGCLFGHPNL